MARPVTRRRALGVIGTGLAVPAAACRETPPEEKPLLKIAVVSDVHHSTQDRGSKLCSQALPLLQQFVKGCAAEVHLDRVVDLGDHIEEISQAADRALIADLVSGYAGIPCSTQHIPGNHDVYNHPPSYWEDQFNSSFSSRSEDINGFHLVYFCPNVNDNFGRQPHQYSDSELAWLRDDLASTRLPAIIFTHVPIHGGSLKGNGYFALGGSGEFINGDTARAIIRASTTTLVISGHTHWNAWHVEDDIHYITIPSLTEMRRTPPHPSGSTAVVEMGKHTISVKVRGRDAVGYTMRRRVGASVWL